MKRNWKKITLTTIAIIFALHMININFANPISQHFAIKTAQARIDQWYEVDQWYPTHNMEISDITFDRHMHLYSISYTDDNYLDVQLTIRTTAYGNYIDNSCGDIQYINPKKRITQDYEQQMLEIFDETTLSQLDCTIKYNNGFIQQRSDFYYPEMDYDLEELSKTNSFASYIFYCDDKTIDKAAEIVNTLVTKCQANEIYFTELSFSILNNKQDTDPLDLTNISYDEVSTVTDEDLKSILENHIYQ